MPYPINPLTGRAIRGFAAMPLERRIAIARKGGASVPAPKRSFSLSTSLATSAGSKGGAASRGGGRKKRETPVTT